MTLKVAFSDLWPGANPEQTTMLRALRAVAPAEVVHARDAELLLYSAFGPKHASFVGTKVLFTGENTPPNLHEADFSIGHYFLDDPRYLRFPEFVALALNDRFRDRRPPPSVPWAEREFCLLLASNPTRSASRCSTRCRSTAW